MCFERMLGFLDITVVTYRDYSLPVEKWPWTRPQCSCLRLGHAVGLHRGPWQGEPGEGDWSCAAPWLMELPCCGWVCLEEF